ncbi:MAG: hypothetical protein LC803_16800 [Acidobacteria bacterium]|nr:hypothetical protein [Acidobacteriota bacterium]
MRIEDMTLIIPDRMTESAATYLKVHFEIIAYLKFTDSMAADVDRFTSAALPILINWVTAAKQMAVLSQPKLDEFSKSWEEIKDEPLRMSKEKERFDYLLSSMIFTKAVDNFLCYLADVLSEVFTVRPEILKSNETKRVDWILSFNDFNALVSAIAEDKVLTLSHSNIKDLDKYMQEKLGLPLLEVPELLEQLTAFIEYRNLIVHNRGIVNSLSKKKSKLIDEPAGTKTVLEWEEIWYTMEFLCVAMNHIDQRIADKFNVPTPHLGEEVVRVYGEGRYGKTKFPVEETATE